MGIFGTIEDFGGDAISGIKDVAGVVKDVVGESADDVANSAREALHTVAYGASVTATSPFNLNARMLNKMTGKDILPELEVIGASDTARKIGDFVEPVTDARDYIENLGGEFGHSGLYALQQPINGIGQIVNKVSPVDFVPELHIIEKPEAAHTWSPVWFAQQAGMVPGTVAPLMVAGGGMLSLGSRVGERTFAMAGVTVPQTGSTGLRIVSTLTGTASVGFGYGFVTKPSSGNDNFWVDRVESGALTVTSVGGQSLLKNATSWLDNVSGEVVYGAVDTNAQSVVRGDGLAEPEDYVQKGASKAFSASAGKVKSLDSKESNDAI